MAEAGFKITRIFDAPPDRVWREWTEPEAFADWFGGPDFEVPIDSVSMDVRVGGAWSATMLGGPGRGEIHWHGSFKEVDPPRRLVVTMSDQPGNERFELIIVELIDLGDGRTEMRFEQRGDMTPEHYERTKSGWGAFFDRMTARLGA